MADGDEEGKGKEHSRWEDHQERVFENTSQTI